MICCRAPHTIYFPIRMIFTRRLSALTIVATAVAVAACSGDPSGADGPEIGRVTVKSPDGTVTYSEVVSECGLMFCPITTTLFIATGASKDVLLTAYLADGSPASQEIRVKPLSTNFTWTAGTQQGNSLTGTVRCTAAGSFAGEVQLWSNGKRVSSLTAGLIGSCT